MAWWERAVAAGYYRRRGYTSDYTGARAFIPAADTNFRQAERGVADINRIVIHITGGTQIGSAINDFAAARRRKRSSAHYLISREGTIYQMVHEADVAFHAGSANGDSIGIEHVANNHGQPPSEETYMASAHLCASLARKYNIAINRTNFLGHQEADRTTGHNCPGPNWDWTRFLGYVRNPQCVIRAGGGMIGTPL